MKVPTFFKNRYVLYISAILGVSNLLGYIAMENYDSMALLVIMFLLTRYFSKNIAFNICIALVVTSLVTMNSKIREGYTKADKLKIRSDKLKKGTKFSPTTVKNKQSNKQIKDSRSLGIAQKKQVDPPKDPVKPEDPIEEPPKEGPPKEEPPKESPCPEGTEFVKGECIPMRRGFQNNVPSSKPAKVSDADDDMNVAAKMEDAYGNLNKMLGDGAMKSMANETKKLVIQQKELMNTLSSMTPALNKAKETLKNLNLPNMEEMTGILKKFT